MAKAKTKERAELTAKAPFFLVSWTPFSVGLASKVSSQSWQAINVLNVAFMSTRRNQSVWAERETAFNEMNAAVMATSGKAGGL